MVVPAAVRRALEEHARAEVPNEACGLILLDGNRAVSYVPGTNVAASPYRFELYIDPFEWADIGDTDLEQAIFHSHLSSPPRPSRTDVENIGEWKGRPYVIFSVRTGELAAWRISEDGIEPVTIEEPGGVHTP